MNWEEIDDLDDMLWDFERTLTRLGFGAWWPDDERRGYAMKYGTPLSKVSDG